MSLPEFSKLPAELVILVMTRLETPRDLLAFIKTSRPVRQTFQENRVAILGAVIRNVIPYENIHVAVAACEASQTSKLWWAKSSAAVITESRDRFREKYAWGRVPAANPLRDWNLLLSLYKLWWISDHFTTCFEEDALRFATGKMPLMQDEGVGGITSTERGRLQRAFFQFEIYRRITPEASATSSAPDAEYEEVLEVLQWFPPWEREGILSVQEFLVEFVKNMCRRLMDYLVLEVSSMARDMAARSGSLHGTFEREPMSEIKMVMDLDGLDIFHPVNERRYQYFVARGLPFIIWLSNLPPKDRIMAIERNSVGSCSISFFEAIFDQHNKLTSFDAEMDWSDEDRGGLLNGPNQGWLWAKTHGLTADARSLLTRHALRKMGYVFWDTARLHKQWTLPFTSPSLLELHERSWDDDDRDWGKEPGIEERFKDIPIPKDAFHDRTEGPVRRLRASDEMLEKVESGYPKPFSSKEAELFDIEY